MWNLPSCRFLQGKVEKVLRSPLPYIPKIEMHFGRALSKQAFYFRKFPSLIIPRFSSSVLDYISESPEACRTKTIGWVQSIRRHKTKTFLNVNDGTSSTDLQANIPAIKAPYDLLEIHSISLP
ncbi:hypothetical protein ACTXT7_000173 [Hymenolepis weldensis]